MRRFLCDGKPMRFEAGTPGVQHRMSALLRVAAISTMASRRIQELLLNLSLCYAAPGTVHYSALPGVQDNPDVTGR